MVKDSFVIDYRNTQDPSHDIDTNSIMFMFAGELFYNGQGCSEFIPTSFNKLNIPESYLAISG